jgi:hypothetical protein
MFSNFANIKYGYDKDAILQCRDESTCSQWRNIVNKQFQECDINCKANKNGNYVFNGQIKNYLYKLSNTFDIFVQYWAPNRATKNYNGRVLIFPNEEIAYEDTINQGVAKILDGEFTFNIEQPNSYYTQMGTILNQSQVKFRFCDGNGKLLSNIYTVKLE